MPLRRVVIRAPVVYCLLASTLGFSAGKVQPPPPGTSTVLLRFDFTGGVASLGYIRVLNLETRTVALWPLEPVVQSGGQYQNWVAAYAKPGRYLIADHPMSLPTSIVTGTHRPGNSDTVSEIRCEISVPQVDAAIFYGTISPNTPDPLKVRQGNVEDAAVREFYDKFVPFKRSSLTAGQITVMPDSPLTAHPSEQAAADLTPVSPKPYADPTFAATVRSLRPSFGWRGPPGQRVDLAIWEAIPSRLGPYQGIGRLKRTAPASEGIDLFSNWFVRGEQVYFKEAIGDDHQDLDIDLRPDAWYYWAIKPSGSDNWARVAHSVDIPFIAGWSENNSRFLIVTTKSAK